MYPSLSCSLAFLLVSRQWCSCQSRLLWNYRMAALVQSNLRVLKSIAWSNSLHYSLSYMSYLCLHLHCLPYSRKSYISPQGNVSSSQLQQDLHPQMHKPWWTLIRSFCISVLQPLQRKLFPWCLCFIYLFLYLLNFLFHILDLFCYVGTSVCISFFLNFPNLLFFILDFVCFGSISVCIISFYLIVFTVFDTSLGANNEVGQYFLFHSIFSITRQFFLHH